MVRGEPAGPRFGAFSGMNARRRRGYRRSGQAKTQQPGREVRNGNESIDWQGPQSVSPWAGDVPSGGPPTKSERENTRIQRAGVRILGRSRSFGIRDGGRGEVVDREFKFQISNLRFQILRQVWRCREGQLSSTVFGGVPARAGMPDPPAFRVVGVDAHQQGEASSSRPDGGLVSWAT